MKKKLYKTYEKIHKEIKKNIASIKDLLNVLVSLSDIVKTMSLDQVYLQEKLLACISNIQRDITSLVSQTTTLFDLFVELGQELSEL